MPTIDAEARRVRRQQIVEAGWRVLARTGYRHLTVDGVCAEARVSKGAFYTYFHQKQDLLMALLDDDAAGLEAIIEDLAESHSPGVDRIRRYLRAAVERGQSPGFVQIRADVWAEVRADPAIGERFAATIRRRTALLAGWIREAVDGHELVDVPPIALASIILALSDGLTLHNSIDPEAFRWSKVRPTIDSLLNGIAQKDPTDEH